MSEAISVALVAGARLRLGGTASSAMRRRVAAAVDLWRCGAASHLIMSGGAVSSPVPEAHVMAHLAQAQGVPGHAIILEAMSRNSRENIAMSLAKLSGLHVTRLILVSDVWHLPRLRMLTCIIGRGMKILVIHVPASSAEPLWRQWKPLVREIGALVADSVRGWFIQPVQIRTTVFSSNAEEDR